MTIAIGTSGWSYDHREPELYPPGLPARDRLARYAAEFGTVELNASFYRWPRAAAFASWRRRLPDGFALSVKAPRGLTHARKLYEPGTWLERITAGWHELGARRAVLLVQLAPAQARDDARLAYFLRLVPDWMRVTADFAYVRLHGPDHHHLYAGSYSDTDLAWWADAAAPARLISIRSGRPAASTPGSPQPPTARAAG